MSREETVMILRTLACQYKSNSTDIDTLTSIWQFAFADCDFEEVKQATLAFMTTDKKGFFPMPACIKDMIVKKYYSLDVTAGEAWDMVLKAIQKGGYYALEEFEKLSYEIQKCIGSANTIRNMALDENFNSGVEKSHFIRCYDTMMKRKQESLLLPQNIRNSMAGYEIEEKTKTALLEETTTETPNNTADEIKITHLINDLKLSLCIS
jgi:hypothetical protein